MVDDENYFLIDRRKRSEAFSLQDEYIYKGDNEDVTSLTVPEGIVTIGKDAFSDLEKLEVVTLPSTLRYIDDFAFSNCTSLTSVTIPQGVERIGNVAFKNCKMLSEVILPSTLKEIGIECFSNCKKLQHITLPPSLEVIKFGAFQNCITLSSIIIPNSVKNMEQCVFELCVKLKKIKLSSSLKVLKDNTFHQCISLREVEIPESVTELRSNCFARCVKLKKIKGTKNIKKIGSFCFLHCVSLKELYLPSFVVSVIDKRCARIKADYLNVGIFNNCKRLALFNNLPFSSISYLINNNEIYSYLGKEDNEVIVPNLSFVTKIASHSFAWCMEKKVITQDNIKVIGNRAFLENINLTDLVVNDNIEEIESNIILDCENLQNFSIRKDFRNFKTQICHSNDNLEGLVVKDGLYIFNNVLLDNYSFNPVLDLTKYPEIKGIAREISFVYTKKIILNYSFSKIDSNTFYYCDKLETVIIPPSVVKIESNAFNNCPNLTSVILPSTTKIEIDSFCNCEKLIKDRYGRPKNVENSDEVIEEKDNIIDASSIWEKKGL